MTYVLIVDDDEVQLELMTIYLQRLGINQYFTARSGEEAMSLLRNNWQNIAIVITDKNMPKMNGLELIEKIRMYFRFDHIKIVMTTSELTRQAYPLQAEVDLRTVLKERGVLPLPKESLNANVLGTVLEQLADV